MALMKQIMNKFRCIVFDLDGTLIDSVPHLFHVYKQFLAKFGHIGTKKEFELLNGPKLDQVVKILKKKYGLKFPLHKLQKSYNKEVEKMYCTKIIPKKGVIKFLKFLKNNNYKIGLVTSSNKKNTNSVLIKNNLKDYFSFFVYGNDVTISKPNSKIYKLCINRSLINKNEIMVLEDSKNGYTSAKNAGLYCKKTTNFKLVQNWLVKNNIAPKYEIIKNNSCVLYTKPSKQKISKKTQTRIDFVWREIQKNRRIKLSNKKVLSMQSISKKKKISYITGEFINYKNIISDRIDSKINLNLYQIGVSGMILFKNNGINYTIFSKRGKHNTEYPNYYELIPSGNLNQRRQKGKKINFNLDLIKEFTEETGLDPKNIKKISFLCLIKDKQNHVYDICNIIELSVNKNYILQHFTSKEYSKPVFVLMSSLPKFIKNNHTKIIPTTNGILDYILN
jgi:HAD superfamily hydrolase (TIGR01509 family)